MSFVEAWGGRNGDKKTPSHIREGDINDAVPLPFTGRDAASDPASRAQSRAHPGQPTGKKAMFSVRLREVFSPRRPLPRTDRKLSEGEMRTPTCSRHSHIDMFIIAQPPRFVKGRKENIFGRFLREYGRKSVCLALTNSETENIIKLHFIPARQKRSPEGGLF